jgi:hypothetical protein
MMNLTEAEAYVGREELERQLARWDENRGPLFVGVISSVFAVAFITVILRLAGRWKMRTRFLWDDYLIITALVNPP